MSQSKQRLNNFRHPLTTFLKTRKCFAPACASLPKANSARASSKWTKHAKLDPAMIKQCFDLGLMGIETPEEYGGAGATFFTAILAVEELSRVDASVGVFVDVQNTLVNNAFIRWGNRRTEKEILDASSPLRSVGAYALSEAGSGSDAFAMQTRAVDKGDHYVINGRKLWITNGNEAEIFVLFANANPEAGYRGITAFIVEKSFPGFSSRQERKQTRHPRVVDRRVDTGRLQGAERERARRSRQGIQDLDRNVERRPHRNRRADDRHRRAARWKARLLTPASANSLASRSISFRECSFNLAEMATELEAARLMVYNAARMKDAGMNFVKEAAMAKLYSSRAAERISSKAIELYGGYGYVKDYPVEKYWRDSKIGAIYEGTSNMQLQTIAKLIDRKVNR